MRSVQWLATCILPRTAHMCGQRLFEAKLVQVCKAKMARPDKKGNLALLYSPSNNEVRLVFTTLCDIMRGSCEMVHK